jgi:predicted ATPase
MARLDRLGPAKELAQIGATIGREFSHALLAAVARKPEAELGSSLDLLIGAGLLFRKGVPPHATYLFKHTLVQDAAYGTLLRQPRRVFHARIADTLERQFAETAEGQPDLLARHYAGAGLIDKAAALWGKTGLRSLERSALVEAVEQLTRALGQIATLPSTPALRREEIKLQVALIYPLMHVRGLAAPESKTAAERARVLIEQAEALGEPPDELLLVFAALAALYTANIAAFNVDVGRERAAQLLALAEKLGDKVMLRRGHCCMGITLTVTGNFAESLLYFDQALALYDPVDHLRLPTRFTQDPQVVTLMYRSLALWALGYPEAALAGAEQALSDARETSHAASLMRAMSLTCLFQVISGNYAIAKVQSDEMIVVAEEKGSPLSFGGASLVRPWPRFHTPLIEPDRQISRIRLSDKTSGLQPRHVVNYWKTSGMLGRAWLLALTGKTSDAVGMFTSAIAAWGSMETTLSFPVWLSHLARACGKIGQFDDVWSYIDEAITAVETTKEKWYEADVHRIAGEIALMSPERDAAKAEACFERALAIARAQQAKSWELRAAMSKARLWRDQGKRDEARELLAPVYGWFTEGFDTLDLKQAKALLDELA